MNPAAEQAWSRPPEQLDTMAMPSDMTDVDNFFNFGEIDLDGIPNVDPSQYGDQMQQPGTHPSTPFNEMAETQLPAGTSTHEFGGHEQFGMAQGLEQQQPYMPRDHSQAPTSHPFTTESMYQPSMRSTYHGGHPQQFQFHQQQQVFPPGHHVPPTPNSFDMHGEAGRFMQQHQQLDPQQRAIMEQRYQLRKDDAVCNLHPVLRATDLTKIQIAFTPMVSPAGTPQYSMQPDLGTTVPGAYFSPLTSPMLHAERNAHHAQQRYHQQQGYYTNPSTAPSSNATSPVDPSLDVDMTGDVMLPEAINGHARKSRRKPATSRSAAPRPKVRQSPVQKPQKRKSGTLSSVVPPKEVDKIVAEAQRASKSTPVSAGLQIPAPFNGSSEDGSISPEPLSESLMGPPPRPGSSLTQSPAMTAQQKDANAAAAVGHAATPKSLLSMRGGDQQQQPISGHSSVSQTSLASLDAGIDDLQLPEAASQHTARPALSQINTQVAAAGNEDQTPRMSARKTPKLGPLSTPASARPSSALPSPSLIGSPMSGSTPSNLLRDRRSDSKGGRGNKKRGSVGASNSTLVSPALRPRISPSIKPLLPEGCKHLGFNLMHSVHSDGAAATLHSPTHALLLASKSNYQNLLEGNHLPGVNYPDSLSTGLTSKRTSHKVAEQGRRNRINEALKEMQSLIPKQTQKAIKDSNSDDSPEAVDADSKESKEDASIKSNSSKAATVESANVYIREMQRQERELIAELTQLRKEREEMGRKLAERASASTSSERSSSGGPIDSASPASVKVQ